MQLLEAIARMMSDTSFIVKQIMFSVLFTHVSCESFNLTSFSVLIDAGGGDSFESVQANIDATCCMNAVNEYVVGGTLDRVVVNEPPSVWAKMYISGTILQALAIMIDCDSLQTKYIAGDINNPNIIDLIELPDIGDKFHIIIENVTKNMETTYEHTRLSETTTMYIGNISSSNVQGTWTSTIVPENVTVELDCKVVENDGTIITAKCDSETTWPDSVFNRIPIRLYGEVMFGVSSVNALLFNGIDFFKYDIMKVVINDWTNTRYNVTTNDGSNFILGDSIYNLKGIPTDFVSYWVDTIHAEVMMGREWSVTYVMLVPPASS